MALQHIWKYRLSKSNPKIMTIYLASYEQLRQVLILHRSKKAKLIEHLLHLKKALWILLKHSYYIATS